MPASLALGGNFGFYQYCIMVDKRSDVMIIGSRQSSFGGKQFLC